MTKPGERSPSFYEQCVAIDVITPIMVPWSKGQIEVDLDTRRFNLIRGVNLHRPWTFSTMCPDRKCGKWLSLYYEFYKILPPPCKQCWKVVYAPASVVELIEFQKFQEELKLPGKCGTEQRDYTSGLGGYRAFWYAPFYDGLKGGRKHFERIKSALIKKFGEDYILKREEAGRFYLKRGCTELEKDFGMSDTWDQIDHTPKYNLLESVWDDPKDMTGEEWSPMKWTNYVRWIEFAIAHNDRSAAEYLHTDKFGVQSIRYQDSDHKTEDFENYINPLNGTMEDNDADDSGTEEKENLLESLDS